MRSLTRPHSQSVLSQRYGSVAAGAVSQEALRLAMVASQLEQIDLAILRVDREIARQNLRKIALLEERAKLERQIASPLSVSA